VGWFSFLISVVPLYLLYNTGHRVLWFLALGSAVANIWSLGVMHNYAVESSAQQIKTLQRNLALEGNLDAEKQRQIDGLKLTVNLNAVPNWLSTLNMVSLTIGLVFLVYGIWLLF